MSLGRTSIFRLLIPIPFVVLLAIWVVYDGSQDSEYATVSIVSRNPRHSLNVYSYIDHEEDQEYLIFRVGSRIVVVLRQKK